MAVKPHPKDVRGQKMDADVTALVTQVALISSTASSGPVAAALDQAQRELVMHYLSIGRLLASSILSTMP